MQWHYYERCPDSKVPAATVTLHVILWTDFITTCTQTCTLLFNIITTCIKAFVSMGNEFIKAVCVKIHIYCKKQVITLAAKYFLEAQLLPRCDTVSAAATYWTDWGKVFKEEATVSQPPCHPWQHNTPHSPNDQTVVQAVWMGSVAECITQFRPCTLHLSFFGFH